MTITCGVIDKSTGALLRAGFCDFENDGSFNSADEEAREDVPFPAKTQGDEDFNVYHRWDGTKWVEVSQ